MDPALFDGSVVGGAVVVLAGAVVVVVTAADVVVVSAGCVVVVVELSWGTRVVVVRRSWFRCRLLSPLCANAMTSASASAGLVVD
ncbi:MAG: hypothetical protein DWQ20_00280, partial [Actinobacteria bacterium]